MQSIASTQKAPANSWMATDCCESLNPESKSKSGVDHGPGQDLGQRPGLDRVRDQAKARVAWTKPIRPRAEGMGPQVFFRDE